MDNFRHLFNTSLAFFGLLLAVGAHAENPVYCGAQLAPGELARYVAKLNSGLASGHVSRTLGPRTGAHRPSIDDWRIISVALTAGKLEPVGWRGCILSNGKASFQADGEGKLVLSSFDPQRKWEL